MNTQQQLLLIVWLVKTTCGQYLSDECHRTALCSYSQDSACKYLIMPHVPSFGENRKCKFVHQGRLDEWLFETNVHSANNGDQQVVYFFNDTDFATTGACNIAKRSGGYKLLNHWMIDNISETTNKTNEGVQCQWYDVQLQLKTNTVQKSRNVVYSKCGNEQLQVHSKWTILYNENDLKKMLKVHKNSSGTPFGFYVSFKMDNPRIRVVFKLRDQVETHRHDIYQLCHTTLISEYCELVQKVSRKCQQCKSANYTHDQCQTFNKCLDHRCLNNGTSKMVGDNCDCICTTGYTGPQCTDHTDHCAMSPCSPNGQCHNIETTYICECNEGYYGSHCKQHSTPQINKITIYIVMGVVSFLAMILVMVWIGQSAKTQRPNQKVRFTTLTCTRNGLFNQASVNMMMTEQLSKTNSRNSDSDRSVTVTDNRTQSLQ